MVGIEAVEAGKIIAVHVNYPSRARQRGRVPAKPSYFLKPTTSLAASGSDVERPAGTELLGFEGEIALVIGSRARRIAPEGAWAYVRWVTASNDFGVYELKAADRGSNLRSKGADGFTPLGPGLIAAADVDPRAIRVRTWLNGKLAQEDTTADLLFPFETLIADLSQLITLEVGDVILTGTPAGASVASPGDAVEVEVDAPSTAEGLTSGRLVSTIVQGQRPLADFGAQPHTDDTLRAEAWGSAEAAGLPAAFELTPELIAKVNSVGVATLSSQLRRLGLNNVSIDGVMASRSATRMVGRARTLRFVPHREDLFERYGGGFNAQKRAFDQIASGEVLVIEARGERGTGTVGDILALRAQVRGAAGIVTDGGVRDVEAVAALDIPTYHAGAHPAVLGRRHVPWDVDLTIACGGATIQPGDIIVGDADGVVVIPPTMFQEVLDGAIQQEREERFIAAQVAGGESVDGLYPMNAQARERFLASEDGAP